MYPLEQKIEAQILQISKPKPTLIFPEANDARVIYAASKIARLAQVVLLADKDQVYQILKATPEFNAKRIEYFFHRVKILDHRKMPDFQKLFAEELVRLSHGQTWEINYHTALNLMEQPSYFAILATHLGYADTVLGGLTMTISEFFSPCLQIFEKNATVFEMVIFALPDEHPEEPYQQRIAVFADVAVNTVMDANKLADIAVETCRITRDIIPPADLPYIYGSIVSYSTKGSASGPSVELVRQAGAQIPEKLAQLAQLNPDYATIKIESELQISCALSAEAAAFKLKDKYRHDSPEGKSNVLIAPNLDLGNFLYHIYALRFPTSKRVLISGGLKNRAIDFSRASTVEDIVLGAKAMILCLKKDPQYQKTRNDAFFPCCRVLAINPGSTSTKIAVFKGEVEEFRSTVSHPTTELQQYDHIIDQYTFRKQAIVKDLEQHGIELKNFAGIVGRGGLLAPIPGGTYRVNEKMKADLIAARYGEHASNLGALIAAALAEEIGKPAYIVDPVVVDEMSAKAKVTGFKEIQRISLWHALNQRTIAKTYAEDNDQLYEEINVIVAHLGGGITVGAHFRGRTVDVNDGVHGDGPFTPERAGRVPIETFLDFVQQGQIPMNELRKKIHGKGGLVDLLGTNDVREVEKRIAAGDEHAKFILNAMLYHVCKEISSLIPAFEGEPIDAIIITGGLAFSEYVVTEMQRYLAPLQIKVQLMPGEKELESLRDGILRVLRGEETALEYC